MVAFLSMADLTALFRIKNIGFKFELIFNIGFFLLISGFSHAPRRRLRIQGPDGYCRQVEMTGSAISQIPDWMTGLVGTAVDDAQF